MAIKAPLVLSLQVGKVRTMPLEGAAPGSDQTWTSAIHKDPVEGPVWLSTINLKGDEQADTEAHGGPDQAVLGYAAEHYDIWREELKQPRLKHGSFGENMTISRLNEQSVCVGDIYEIGEARVQVSQPRRPCVNLVRRLSVPDIVERVMASGRGGWYFRVLTEGHVERGSFVVLVTRPCPQWTVARVFDIMKNRNEDRASALALSECSLLAARWRDKLRAAGEGRA
jgi:MOSC domain-containing protein YiiM